MYKALRTMEVKGADGNYRKVQPGELIPEAAEWPTLRAYIQRQWVTPASAEDRRPKKPAAEPAVEKPVTLPDTEVAEQLEGMRRRELQNIATTLGIDTNQSKAELIASIMEVGTATEAEPKE